MWLLLATGVGAQDAAFPRMLTDGLGNEVVIDALPQRIVSLTLSSDTMLVELVEPERIAALTQLSLDPGISNIPVESAAFATHIASAEDVEQIISLEPDLIFAASFTAPEVVEQYRQVGLTVFVTGTPNSFAAIADNLRLIGAAVGEDDRAEALIARMEADIAAVTAAVEGRAESLRTLYLTPNNYTSGANSSISEIIAAAGGIDVSAAAGIDQYAPLSDEFIIEQNPDVILLSGWTPWDLTFVEGFLTSPTFAGLAAVQNGRVYTVYDAHLTTVSQHISEGVRDVAAYLYPDLYPTYPITLTDAAAETVTVEALPGAVVVTDIHAPLLTDLLDVAGGERGFDLLITDMQDNIGSDRDTLVFAPLGVDAPPVSAPSVTVVRLHPGDSPAERAANAILIGTALSQRTAALNIVAGISDVLEAQAE